MVAALLWKEWREHRWKMLGIFVVYGVIVGFGICGSRYHRLMASMWRGDALDNIQFHLNLLAVFVPGFIAVGTVTEERARRTAETLESLPVELRWAVLMRCVWGMLTLMVPLAAVEGITAVVFWGELGIGYTVPLGYWMLRSILVTGMVYLWTVALGCRCRSEFGVVGIFAGLLSFSYFMVGMEMEFNFDTYINPLHLWPMASGIWREQRWMPTLILAGVGVVLLRVACVGLSRPVRGRRGKQAGWTKAVGGGSFAAQRLPVVWKTWREYRGLVAGYLGVAMFLVGIMGVGMLWGPGIFRQPLYQDVGTILAALLGVFPVILAIVLGVDIGLRDFQDQVEGFWRSRPIHAAEYFLKRVATGLVFLMGMAVVPMGVLCCMAVLGSWMAGDSMGGASGNFLGYAQSYTFEYLAFYVPHTFLVFVGSLLVATLTRRPIMASVIGVGLEMAIMMMSGIGWIPALRAMDMPGRMGALIVYWVVMLVITAGVGSTAVLSVQEDWRGKLDVLLERGPRVKV